MVRDLTHERRLSEAHEIIARQWLTMDKLYRPYSHERELEPPSSPPGWGPDGRPRSAGSRRDDAREPPGTPPAGPAAVEQQKLLEHLSAQCASLQVC